LRRSGSEALLAVVVQAADFGGRTAGNHRSRMTSWPGATITELVVPNSSNSPNGIVAARHGNLQVEDRSQGCWPQPAPIKMLSVATLFMARSGGFAPQLDRGILL
jgi:hypothetical protein